MSTVTNSTNAASIVAPDWYMSVFEAFRSSENHAFILHGDLSGYIEQTQTPRRFLRRALSLPRGGATLPTIVATYHPAQGISFADDGAASVLDADGSPQATMRARAILAVTDGQPAPALNDAAQNALNKLGGTPARQADPFTADTPLAALRALDRLLRAPAARNQVAVIIDDGELVCGAADKTQMGPPDKLVLSLLKLWGRDETLTYASDNLIILLTEELDELHADLRSSTVGWRAVNVPMPNEGRRLAFLNYYLSRRTVDLDGVTTQQLARQTAGLNLKNLEDILLESVAAGSVTVGRVKAAKDRIIASSYSEIAEMLEPLDGGLDALGGMDDLKRFMTNRIVTPINEGRLQHVTKGMLLVGPPGTGKTYAVRGLAGSVGYNVVSLKAENIQSSLVGASERALKRFFAFSIALAPTIIFIDEIDQGNMGKRATNDNNPVAGNLFNQVLQFMSDETLRGKVIVIAASNRPDNLDPALMRPGRMDAIVPVMLPEYGDRKLIAVSAAKGFGATITPDALDALAQNTDRYSAADIASIMRDATWSGKTVLMVNDVIDAVDDHQSNTADKADWYESLAIAACNKKSLLPARFRALANDRAALTAQIKATAPSNEEFDLRGPRAV